MTYCSATSFLRIIAVLLAMLFATQVNMSLAEAAPGGTDFDIPISELNKVKKKTPTKLEKSENKKKKKSPAKPQESSSKTAKPDTPVVSESIAPVGSIGTAGSGTVHSKTNDQNKSLLKAEETTIHHFPYSFVVVDKRTVIHSVISSKNDIKEVTCRVSITEGGAKTLVTMEKVAGTQFTYKADLPPLPPGSSALRYIINVVDSQGKSTRSEEFVTPVAASPVVPSWQLESVTVVVSPEKQTVKEPQKVLPAPATNPVQTPKDGQESGPKATNN